MELENDKITVSVKYLPSTDDKNCYANKFSKTTISIRFLIFFKFFDPCLCSVFAVLCISSLILLHEKFLQFDWLRAVVFRLNFKYAHVKITKPLRVVV